MASLPAALLPRSSGSFRFRWPLVVGGVAGGIVALASLALPDTFRSEVRILSDAGWNPGHGPGVWAPSALPEPPSSREDGPTVVFVDILRSRRLGAQVLEARYDYGVKSWRWGATRQVRGTLLDYLGARSVDEGMGPLRELLSIQRDPKSGLLTLGAQTHSPELSLQVVQGATEQLRVLLQSMGQAAGKDRARFTRARLEEVQGRYREAARAFEGFQEANRNWDASPSPNVRFRGTELKQDVDLWGQVVSNLTLSQEQALLEARNDTQTLLVLDPGSLPLRKNGPPRALYTFAATFAAGSLAWIRHNRTLLKQRLIDKDRT